MGIGENSGISPRVILSEAELFRPRSRLRRFCYAKFRLRALPSAQDDTRTKKHEAKPSGISGGYLQEKFVCVEARGAKIKKQRTNRKRLPCVRVAVAERLRGCFKHKQNITIPPSRYACHLLDVLLCKTRHEVALHKGASGTANKIKAYHQKAPFAQGSLPLRRTNKRTAHEIRSTRGNWGK